MKQRKVLVLGEAKGMENWSPVGWALHSQEAMGTLEPSWEAKDLHMGEQVTARMADYL